MKLVRPSWVMEVQDVMVTIELALHFNHNKDIAVRKCTAKIKHKYSKEINMILSAWNKSVTPYADYNIFMTKAGL